MYYIHNYILYIMYVLNILYMMYIMYVLCILLPSAPSPSSYSSHRLHEPIYSDHCNLSSSRGRHVSVYALVPTWFTVPRILLLNYWEKINIAPTATVSNSTNNILVHICIHSHSHKPIPILTRPWGGELAQLVRAWAMWPWGHGYESRSWLYHLALLQCISLLCITYSIIKG